jgi:hypothetical protein
MPCITIPSDHGPAGSSAVKIRLPRPIASVTTIQKRPSWKRIVGAQAPPSVGTSSSASCSGRSTTCPIGSQRSRSVLWNTGMPGKYSKLEHAR